MNHRCIERCVRARVYAWSPGKRENRTPSCTFILRIFFSLPVSLLFSHHWLFNWIRRSRMRGIKSKFPSPLPYCNEGKRRCSNFVWGEKGKTPFRTSHVLAYSQEKKRQETRECCSIPIDRIFLFLLLYIVSLSKPSLNKVARKLYIHNSARLYFHFLKIELDINLCRIR